MFRCDKCGKVVDGSPVRVVLETREKVYEPRFKKIDPDGPEVEHNLVCVDKGGKGWEIVREADLCPRCAKARDEGILNVVRDSMRKEAA